jgi:hypothetical protein
MQLSRNMVPQSHADVMLMWALDPPKLSWWERLWSGLLEFY